MLFGQNVVLNVNNNDENKKKWRTFEPVFKTLAQTAFHGLQVYLYNYFSGAAANVLVARF